MASRTSSGLAETIKTLVYAIVIALFIRTFFYEPFSIPSASMVPTLLIGDYLFVSKFSYGYSRYSMPLGLPLIPRPDPPVLAPAAAWRRPVFKQPRDPSVDFIKRIVGLPGDTLQMKDGVLNINDKPVTLQRVADYYYAAPFFRDPGCAAAITRSISRRCPAASSTSSSRIAACRNSTNTQLFHRAGPTIIS